eukprot:12924432-Prorocentrum_lima.AAC.1
MAEHAARGRAADQGSTLQAAHGSVGEIHEDLFAAIAKKEQATNRTPARAEKDHNFLHATRVGEA